MAPSHSNMYRSVLDPTHGAYICLAILFGELCYLYVHVHVWASVHVRNEQYTLQYLYINIDLI